MVLILMWGALHDVFKSISSVSFHWDTHQGQDHLQHFHIQVPVQEIDFNKCKIFALNASGPCRFQPSISVIANTATLVQYLGKITVSSPAGTEILATLRIYQDWLVFFSPQL